MITSGLETVFIGDPVNGDDDTIRRSVGVRSLGDSSDILGFGANLLLASTFFHLSAISSFETTHNNGK